MRGFALGVATLVNRTTSGMVALSFLSLARTLTPAGAYYLYACLAVCACLFIRSSVPETKGKSLEEIEREMAERYTPREDRRQLASRKMRMHEMESCGNSSGGGSDHHGDVGKDQTSVV